MTLRSTWSALALICIFVSGPSLAESQVESDKLVVFKRDHHTQWVLDSLGLSAESGDRDHIRLELNPKDQARLESYGLKVLKTEPVPARPAIKTKNSDGYNTPETVVAALEEVASTYPDIARTVTLGYSVDGRPIVGLVLSDNVYTREANEPAMRVLGAHHGDEWSSMEVSLAVGQRLAESYAFRDDVQDLLDNYEIWVVPVVNPDGTAVYSRRNANNVDLNRNYGLTWTPGLGKGTYPFSEPETQAMRMMAYQRAFHHSMSMHSGATNLGWVWNHTLDRTPDEAFLEDVSARYQDLNTTRDFWITNGADWYMVTGDTNDWSYGARGGQDYTLELTARKAPAANSIATYVEEHIEAMIQFLAYDGQRGRKGRVVDVAGRPVEASLTLLDDDGEALTGFSLSSASTGAFQRLGFDGSYTLQVAALGYASYSLPVELAAELVSTPIEITLEPLENFELDIVTPLIFGHSEVTPCINLSPVLPEGYSLAIYRLGNEEPLHPLIQNTEEDCTALSLSYSSIPLWEDQGSWHLLVLNADGVAVNRFEEVVTLLSTSLEELPEPGELTLAENVLTFTLSHASLNPSELEVVALTPGGQRLLPTFNPNSLRFEASLTDSPSYGVWQLRVTLHGQTWALRFENTAEGVIALPPLGIDGVSTTDSTDVSDPSDASDQSDPSESSDPSTAESDTEDPSDAGGSDTTDTAPISPDQSSPKSTDSSGCQNAPGAWLWLVGGLILRRRRLSR